MISKIGGLTMDEFIRLYEEEGPFELIDGERIVMSPPKFGHSYTANHLLRALMNFILPRHLGEAFLETPFVLTSPDDPNWVKGSRVPDVMFIRAERLAAYKQANPNWKEQPLALVPDLVVEIVSPTDRYTDINKKIEQYLEDGVPLAWVLDPQRRAVAVHEAGKAQATKFMVGQTLTGGEVIPGFEIAVSSIFE
jgi:Uma2 family endonuclease